MPKFASTYHILVAKFGPVNKFLAKFCSSNHHFWVPKIFPLIIFGCQNFFRSSFLGAKFFSAHHFWVPKFSIKIGFSRTRNRPQRPQGFIIAGNLELYNILKVSFWWHSPFKLRSNHLWVHLPVSLCGTSSEMRDKPLFRKGLLLLWSP